jgi:hypothetical protein
MRRMFGRVLFTLALSPLFVFDAWAQTINAASCSQHDVVVALGSVSADGTTVNIPSCPAGVTWGPTSAFTSGSASVDANGQLTYNQAYSTVIKGQGTTTGSDSLGNPMGYNDQTVLIYSVSSGEALLHIQAATGKSLRITGITVKGGSGVTTTRLVLVRAPSLLSMVRAWA